MSIMGLRSEYPRTRQVACDDFADQQELQLVYLHLRNEALKFRRLKRRTRSLLQELFLSYSSVRG